MSIQELTDSTTEQLRLISVPAAGAPARIRPYRVPAKLRLDDQTRRIGLAGVAEAQAILAAQAQRRAERELQGKLTFVRQLAA